MTDVGRSVRYLRCQGPFVAQLVDGASSVVVRIESDGSGEWFAGYVALSSDGRALEKSDSYGVYEGEADGFDGYNDDKCEPATRTEFREAWSRPYAYRSRLRRFLARLSGANDRSGDPSQRDESGEG